MCRVCDGRGEGQVQYKLGSNRGEYWRTMAIIHPASSFGSVTVYCHLQISHLTHVICFLQFEIFFFAMRRVCILGV